MTCLKSGVDLGGPRHNKAQANRVPLSHGSAGNPDRTCILLGGGHSQGVSRQLVRPHRRSRVRYRLPSMPKWFDKFLPSYTAPQWTEQHYTKPTSLEINTEKNTQDSTLPSMNTPTTSTAIDTLPPPVVQSLSSSNTKARRKGKKAARVKGLSVHWAQFRKRIGTGTAPDSSSLFGESAAESNYTRRLESAEASDYVDEVVVDRNWSEEIKSSISHSDHGASPEKSGTSHPPERGNSDHESVAEDKFWGLSTPITILRYQAWPLIMEIFSSRFLDDKAEQHYAQVCQL